MTTVNILGTEYKVIREPFKDKDIDGYCDYTSREIRIRDDNVNEVGDFDELMRKQKKKLKRGKWTNEEKRNSRGSSGCSCYRCSVHSQFVQID